MYEKSKTFIFGINSSICNFRLNEGTLNRYYNANNIRLFSKYDVYNSQRIQG